MTADEQPPAWEPLLALPGGPLLVWPVAVLRGAGLPIQDLVALGDPGYAASVDAGPVGDEVRIAAETRQHEHLVAVARRTDLQTAVAWQNPAVLRDAVQPLATATTDRRNQSSRRKERVVARYLARYCGKNDTIGFFGPVCWAAIRPRGAFATVRTGSGLVRSGAVHLEPWAVDALAAVLADDPAVRPWLAPRPHPATVLDGTRLLRTEGPPLDLPDGDLEVLRRCDGRRPARDIAAELSQERPREFPDSHAVYRVLDGLVSAGHLFWDLEPPLIMRPERALHAAITTVGDPEVRSRLDEAVASLESAAREVPASGDVTGLDRGLRALDDRFVMLTGAAPHRRPGETYGGRRLVYQDTTRDTDVAFGPALLDRLGPPLSLLTYSLRQLTAEVARCYEEVFLGAYALIRAGGERDIRLAHVLSICTDEVFTPGRRLFEPVLDRFADRWNALLLVDNPVSEVRLTSAGLWPAVREAFPAAEPGWTQAYQHGADIQIGARDAAALARGETEIVLGELHAAWNTLEAGVFVDQHPAPGVLTDLVERSQPRQRIGLVPVKHHPRVLARTTPAIPDPDQWWLALTGYPGGDPARRINLAGLVVERGRDGMCCRTPDGSARFRVVDVFGMLLSAEIMDAFKLIGADRSHVPRVRVDDLVVTRESWSVPLGDLVLPGERAGEAAGFRVVRELAVRLGLPRFVFAKVPGELKPFYVDLTSSVQTAVLITALRGARRHEDPARTLRLTEMRPGPEHAWLPGPDGERYTSELRLQLVDPGGEW